MSYLVQKMSKDLIGSIYVAKKDNKINKVVICSLDGFGKRINRHHLPGDLIVCGFASNFEQNLNCVRVMASDSTINYKLIVSHSDIIDEESFSLLFQETSKK